MFDNTDGASYADEITTAKENLNVLSEEEFQEHYKASKRQYRAVLKSLEWLDEAIKTLETPGPMDIDSDIIDDAKCTVEDFMRLLERMHMAAYWKSEEQ